jgi:hypothetical protein
MRGVILFVSSWTMTERSLNFPASGMTLIGMLPCGARAVVKVLSTAVVWLQLHNSLGPTIPYAIELLHEVS